MKSREPWKEKIKVCGGEVNIPGGVPKACKHDALVHGLVGMVKLG